ncbi:MAG: glycosyltransferase [Proteobacteria bacterium]|nr:glycosyltransferase [Pseudomonadota bacterium]
MDAALAPMDYPRLSVLLPVYNCAAYISEAVKSVLNQEFVDFELIIIDDGSTDRTPEVLTKFRDSRIRLFHQSNQGLARTLNRAISFARSMLLARQDADDISLPKRFERQVRYMEAHADCGLLGTWAQIMEIDRLSDRFHQHPTSDSLLKYELLFNNPFVHSSIIMRKEIVTAVGGYTTDPARQPPEDYELWAKISRISNVANLPEVHVIYREIPTSISRTGDSPFQQCLVRLSAENIAIAAGLEMSDYEAFAIACLTHGTPSQLQQAPDFHRMRKILAKCVESCSAPSNFLSLKSDANIRVTNMQASWIAHQLPLVALVKRSRIYIALSRHIKKWIIFIRSRSCKHILRSKPY